VYHAECTFTKQTNALDDAVGMNLTSSQKTGPAKTRRFGYPAALSPRRARDEKESVFGRADCDGLTPSGRRRPSGL